MVTKTIGQLHYTDLDPGRFEMMTLLMVYRMRRWDKINHYGAAGSDDGIDIHAEEILENGKRVVHHFQCKRYQRLTKVQLTKIVSDYKKENKKLADYYYIVCGCDISKTASDGFDKACDEAGISNYTIWTASYIEAALYSDYHDVLYAFFGIDMTGERNNRISAVRRNVALKKRLRLEMEKEHLKTEELAAIRRGDFWKKFEFTEVLIRSIYDRNYPERSPGHQGFYKTEVYNWYHNGLEVRTCRYVRTGKIRIPKPGKTINSDNPDDFEIVEMDVEEYGQIPFENIIEVDMEGDEYYRIPHLYCDFPCGSDPYENIGYKFKNGYPITEDMIFDLT